MSAAESHAVSAVAFQLVAALERYEEHTSCLVREGARADLYVQVGDEMDEIQQYSASLPVLSVASVALLIAHAELLYSVWSAAARHGESAAAVRSSVVQEHRACIECLRRACMRQIRR